MAHEFLIKRNGKIESYDSYDDIPQEFDTVIKFAPEIPPPPHSHEQHEQMETWNTKLQDLIKRAKY